MKDRKPKWFSNFEKEYRKQTEWGNKSVII